MSYYFESRMSLVTAKQQPKVNLLGIDDEFHSFVAETYGLVGKLDGICQFVPNIDFYVNLLMTQEICASCNLEDVPVLFYSFFEAEKIVDSNSLPLNLLNAIKYALNDDFSESFVKKVHGILARRKTMESNYRSSQGGSIKNVLWSYGFGSNPVPANCIHSAISDMQKYIADVGYQNALIMAAEIQYQFEILEPFDEYSKMIARIIAMLVLKWGSLLSYPVLWLSDYFIGSKIEYKDRLVAAYKGGEETLSVYWTKYFLKAVNTSAKKAISIIESLEYTRKKNMATLPQISGGNKSIQNIYEYVANAIIVNVRQISDELNLSFSGVTQVLKSFEEVGIVRQVTQKKRYRKFGYAPVLNLIAYR